MSSALSDKFCEYLEYIFGPLLLKRSASSDTFWG